MKKVLVTGAAGIIGSVVVKYLLSEGKYEITLLDLKNKRSVKRLKKYSRRVNIIYGDINNEVLVEALVRDHDIIIHLAGALPPFANLKKDLCRIVDYEGTKNVVDAIRMYNPKCHLLYVSSTTIYGREKDNEHLVVDSEAVIHEDDYYSQYKLDAERIIKGQIKNYSIFRIPAVYGTVGNDLPMYTVPKKSVLELVSVKDVSYALVSSMDNLNKVNKRIFNLSGGEKSRTTYRKYLINMLMTYGITFRLLVSLLLADKNFYSGYYEDGDDLEEILGFRTDSLDSYYRRLNSKSFKNSRVLQRFLAKPVVYVMKRRDEK